MATTLTIDGTKWTYENGAWRTEWMAARIAVVLKTEYVVETLTMIYGGGEWITAYLTDTYGWEWEYDGESTSWTYWDEAVSVTLQLDDGVWRGWRTGLGTRLDKVIGYESELTLIGAIDELHNWLAQLWGSRIGGLVWDDELSAYVGSLGGWDVELYSTQTGWCAEISDDAEVHVVKSSFTDPRAVLTQLEATYGEA